MKSAKIYFDDILVGILTQDESGFTFTYLDEYLNSENSRPISLTLPLRKEPYKSKFLFPFFDGLVPEGFLLNLACSHFHLNYLDRMSILLKTAKDVVGNVSVREIKDE